MQKESFFAFTSNEKQKKLFKLSIIGFITIFILALVFFFVNWIVNIDKTASIKILVAPTDAIVTIDDKTYGTDQTIRVIPGDYDVKIEKDGFNIYHEVITAKDGETYYLYEFLSETNENGTFYKDNEKEASRAQEISDFHADKYHESYNGTDPIWNVTPYKDYSSGIKIFAEKDENEKIILNIRFQTCDDSKVEKLKQNALNYLNEKGINLKNYSVNYAKLC